MGVIPCDRSGCTNIMCDRYSWAYGRICDSCFEELCRSSWPLDSIAEFMACKPRPDQYQKRRGELDGIFDRRDNH